MFGLQNFGVLAAYLLCILSTVACVIYGAVNWNKGGSDVEEQKEKAVKWIEEEVEIEEKL